MSLSITQIQALSQAHIRHVDKWYRMFAGLSSDLKRYEDGILTLEIHNTAQHLPSDDVTALKMARSWVNWRHHPRHAGADLPGV